jgi:hypothetical protein
MAYKKKAYELLANIRGNVLSIPDDGNGPDVFRLDQAAVDMLELLEMLTSVVFGQQSEENPVESSDKLLTSEDLTKLLGR